MCPECRLRDGNNNLYRQIIIPIAFESDLLRRSVLAVGANRLNIQRTALHHEAAVLRALQGRLSDNIVNNDRHRFPRVEILAVVLLLCFYELDSPSDRNPYSVQPWRVHMQGAQHITENYLPSSSASSSSLESGIISFLAQYFAARCTLTYSATRVPDGDNDILNSARYWLGLIDRPTREINLFAGCSNELLALLLTVAQAVNSNSSRSEGYLLDGIHQEIQNVRQDVPFTMQSTSTIPQAEGIAMTAEAFRLATLVLVESLSADRSNDMRSSNRGVKKGAISSLFELLTMRTIPLVSPCGTLGACSYLWPYYIASCHMINQRERDVLYKTVKGLNTERTSDSKEGTRQQLVINHILLTLENRRTTKPPIPSSAGNMIDLLDLPVSANHGAIEWS
ncbi:hypothetical protein N7540_005537 [Penicillium herquei]|nr:hypothetical protein N7540_005537 [Penicillium herquei]